MTMYSVYILFSENLQKHYIGYSSDYQSRIVYHNDSARNQIWTKRGIPWKLFHLIGGLTEPQAIATEKHIKKMKSKKYIQNLWAYPEMNEKLKARFG
ncbi:MAG: GIY-YIG nuclease family protein [Bacteroidota bacterium]